MVIIESYGLAIVLCFITMICWGSWANTQKLASKEWRFQLYYWDYSIGVLLLSLLLAFTMGSMGTEGRSFIPDLSQASSSSITYAFLGGVVFNLANILLVAAIDIAGMSVAFPIGIGIALIEGVILNYIFKPEGSPSLLFLGVAAIAVAIILDAIAYKRIPSEGSKTTGKGIGISVAAGILMGLFYYLVQASMVKDFKIPDPGYLGPYAATVIFSVGLFLSNFIFNTFVMKKPFTGEPVAYADYFKGNTRLHLIGVLGGVIWSIGMGLNIIASGTTSPAISYGLGQGATMIAAFWGVFIWKEFKDASAGTSKFLFLMFVLYIAGIILIIIAK